MTGKGRMEYSFDLAAAATILGDGVTVAQQFLVLLVQVRILIPQVLFYFTATLRPRDCNPWAFSFVVERFGKGSGLGEGEVGFEGGGVDIGG